jgi:hypothetical protein
MLVLGAAMAGGDMRIRIDGRGTAPAADIHCAFQIANQHSR